MAWSLRLLRSRFLPSITQKKRYGTKLQTGIVGLPNVGKSTLFNALVGSATAQAANYPFCTIEPNGMATLVPNNQ